MNIFSLPTTAYNLKEHVYFYSMTSNSSEIVLNQSIAMYIRNLKEHIDSVNEQWDYTKKITNPYEYIHTPLPTTHISIAKYKPLSRAYFKMIELLHTFNIKWDYPIKSFHLAEGPGGFIEALLKERDNPHDCYVGMTLVSSDFNTPGWRKTQRFLSRWKDRIRLEYGVDKTGNLFSYENYVGLTRERHTYDLLTGDGGFDFSVCYNMQECLSSRLIFAQIVYACMLQKNRGTFVLKIFDCFTQSTIDMIWILCSVYRTVYITKPCTSRYANSEKYLVCKEYRQHAGEQLLPRLEMILKKLETPPPGMHIQRLLSVRPPLYFMNQLQEINAVFGQQQMEMIQFTLTMIHMNQKEQNEKIKVIQHGNLQKCVAWCKKYNEPYMTLTQTYAEALSSKRYRPPSFR